MNVGLHGIREIGEFEGQKIGIREAHHCRAASLGERAAVDEVGVAEVRVPVKIVVNRMIDAAAVFSAKPEVRASDADVLEERREVGAGAESVDAQVGALRGFLAFFVGMPLSAMARKLPALPDGEFRFRILNVAGHVVDELFQRVRTCHSEIAASVAVGIDVGDGVLAKFVGVRLDPFGRAEQAGLFAIPRAIR